MENCTAGSQLAKHIGVRITEMFRYLNFDRQHHYNASSHDANCTRKWAVQW